MKTTKTSDMVNNSEEIANFEQRERTDSNPISHGDDVNKNIEVIYERSQQQNFCQNLSTAVQSNITQSGTRTILGTKLGENVATESHKIDPFREMLKLLQQSPDKVNQDVSIYAYLTVLDFAGQYAFYTTHQMFLIAWAIYLLVSDASRDISDLVEDECYFDSEGIMQCQIYERKPTDAEILIHTEDADSSAASDRTTPSDIGQIFTPLVPADDFCDAIPINNQFEPHNKGLCSDENHNSQGVTPVNNKGFHSSGNHHNNQGATPVNNKGLYSSAASINKNKGLYSSGKHQHTQGDTMANNKGWHSIGNQHTQGSTSVNNNNGMYYGGNHQHTQGATSVKNKGLLSSEYQHTQGPTSVNNNRGVYSRGKHQHTRGATSVDNMGLYSSGNQQTQNSTSFNGNNGVYSSGNQHTQCSTSFNGNSGVYSGGNHQHTQGSTSVYNNKTQIPSDFNQPPLDSRMIGKLADFKTGSTPETRQQAKTCNQDNILPIHPGFIVTGLPSKMRGSGSSKMDHNQSFEDANFNMRSSNSQPPKTIIKAAEMGGNVNNHYCNQDLFVKASDKNGGKGDSSSLRGGQSRSKGGNSNEQSNSWYRSIGGHAPSFAPGHMTEPYTRDVQQPEISRKYEARRCGYLQQPESRKSEARRGGYVQQAGTRKSETKRGDYVQQPGSWKSEIKADGYIFHSFQTVEGSTSNGLDPYEMHAPTFRKRSDGYLHQMKHHTTTTNLIGNIMISLKIRIDNNSVSLLTLELHTKISASRQDQKTIPASLKTQERQKTSQLHQCLNLGTSLTIQER